MYFSFTDLIDIDFFNFNYRDNQEDHEREFSHKELAQRVNLPLISGHNIHVCSNA